MGFGEVDGECCCLGSLRSGGRFASTVGGFSQVSSISRTVTASGSVDGCLFNWISPSRTHLPGGTVLVGACGLNETTVLCPSDQEFSGTDGT